MEPESSLPHSQMSANCRYPKPHRSSPYPHQPLPEDPSQYYPPIYVLYLVYVKLVRHNLPQHDHFRTCVLSNSILHTVKNHLIPYRRANCHAPAKLVRQLQTPAPNLTTQIPSTRPSNAFRFFEKKINIFFQALFS